jgi:hypothetical protein
MEGLMSYRFAFGLPFILLAGCSLTSLLGDDGGLDGGGIFNPDAQSMPPDDAGGPGKSIAFVRLAQLSPILGAVDFCLRPKGVANFDGPKLTAQLPNIDASFDASTGGVLFPGVSGYLQVPALGTTDVAIVSASDTSCSSPKVVGTVTIDPNKRMTVAVMGAIKDPDSGTKALGITAFIDDTQPHADAARLRIIHAALGTATAGDYGSLSASIGFGNQVDPIAGRVDPRHAAAQSNTPPVVDALGYASHPPITGQSSLRFASLSTMGGPWSTPPVDLGLAVNAVKTAFLVSVDSTFSVLLCGDLPSGGDVPCQLYPAK